VEGLRLGFLAPPLRLLLGLDGADLGVDRRPLRLLPGRPPGEDRLPLGGGHPGALELHVAAGPVALLLADPSPVEADPAQGPVSFLVVRQDFEEAGPGVRGLAGERVAGGPAGELAPRLGVARRDLCGARPELLHGRDALLDADDARHTDRERAAADVHRDGLLGLLDDLAHDPAAAAQVDLVRIGWHGRQRKHHDGSSHAASFRRPRLEYRGLPECSIEPERSPRRRGCPARSGTWDGRGPRTQLAEALSDFQAPLGTNLHLAPRWGDG
jgi:hypothetical protein